MGVALYEQLACLQVYNRSKLVGVISRRKVDQWASRGTKSPVTQIIDAHGMLMGCSWDAHGMLMGCPVNWTLRRTGTGICEAQQVAADHVAPRPTAAAWLGSPGGDQ